MEENWINCLIGNFGISCGNSGDARKLIRGLLESLSNAYTLSDAQRNEMFAKDAKVAENANDAEVAENKPALCQFAGILLHNGNIPFDEIFNRSQKPGSSLGLALLDYLTYENEHISHTEERKEKIRTDLDKIRERMISSGQM